MKSLIWRQNCIGWLARFFYKCFGIKIGHIPDNQILWRKVFNTAQIKPNGDLKSVFFRDKRGVSCDLSRFTTKEKLMKKPVGNPELWIRKPGLVAFSVLSVRSLSDNKPIDVLHDPNFYSHCIFSGRPSVGQVKRLKEKSYFEEEPKV